MTLVKQPAKTECKAKVSSPGVYADWLDLGTWMGGGKCGRHRRSGMG